MGEPNAEIRIDVFKKALAESQASKVRMGRPRVQGGSPQIPNNAPLCSNVDEALRQMSGAVSGALEIETILAPRD